MENNFHFSPNARAVQEQLEEKSHGRLPEEACEQVREYPENSADIPAGIAGLRARHDLPFVATDRNVLNLPGVGKSLTYRVVGITRYGRRILEFDHDSTRIHSPIIEKMGKVVIIESKSIGEYLEQLESLGEEKEAYAGLYGYSIGVTEARMALYEYPEYDYELTKTLTNLELPE